jgi:hypothetical protein
MTFRKLSLKILPGRITVCRLAPAAELPDWIGKSSLFSITRTDDELSVVCTEATVPPGTLCERGWRCFQVRGPLDFSETGILFSVSKPLAESGISLFVVSTFDTDYFMVKEKNLAEAIDVLTAAGHRVSSEDRIQK